MITKDELIEALLGGFNDICSMGKHTFQPEFDSLERFIEVHFGASAKLSEPAERKVPAGEYDIVYYWNGDSSPRLYGKSGYIVPDFTVVFPEGSDNAGEVIALYILIP